MTNPAKLSLPNPNWRGYGHDTEFFLWDTKKEEVVPSFKYFGKKEEEPEFPNFSCTWGLPVIPEPENLKSRWRKDSSWCNNSSGPVRVFRDGLAVEVNSVPVQCRAWIWQDIRRALGLAEARFGKRKPANLIFSTRPYVKIDPKGIKDFPEDLKVLGCLPSLDAYTEAQKTIKVDPLRLPFRTSGAHIHVSFSYAPREEDWAPYIKIADSLAGVAHAYIFGDELEFKRRKLYGQAGEFRFQTYNPGENPIYGLEYRVLSSRIYNHPGMFSFFFGLFKFIIAPYANQLWTAWDPGVEDYVREAINLGSPSAFEKAIPFAEKLIRLFPARYELGLARCDWKALLDHLKELNLKGEFPDGGIYTHDWPEAHKGWREYRREWNF